MRMDDANPVKPPLATPAEDRLESWKEIAAYLNRDVTTVQRWERREAMPVHRHLHEKMGSVYASKAELDAWSRTRNSASTQENESSTIEALPAGSPTSRTKRRMVLAVAAGALALVVGTVLWTRTDYFWRNPIVGGRWETLTSVDAVEQSASVSRDGSFVAFLSDRGGQMDVWVTQVGTGQFHNLTRGSAPELVNPSVRTLGFSPDGSLVTFWLRRESGVSAGEIGIWATPTLGGQPRPYLEGVAEFDWSRDGTRLAYHTASSGDPLFVTTDRPRADAHPIFTAPTGLHSHFPLWSLDGAFLYFVHGSLPDKLDIWRIPGRGGTPERITSHSGRVSHPVLLGPRTLLYLATDPDASGPWLYGIDVERRIPRRLTSGPDRYTSLAASADGRRLVLTRATPKMTLWRIPISDSPGDMAAARRIALTTSTGFAPRLGRDYVLYASTTGAGGSIWKVADQTATELWRGSGARLIGGPEIGNDGRQIAFSVRQDRQTLLYVMQADGTNARIVTDSLVLHGSLAWAPDGASITTAAEKGGIPRLFRVPLNAQPPSVLVNDYSVDPAWSPDGRFLLYSGPENGVEFIVKAATREGAPYRFPPLTLTRGARRLAFLPGGRALLFLRGEIHHKNLWLLDLHSGAQRQLTDVAHDFDIRDFDISPEGDNAVLQRVQESSEIVLLDMPRS
jgi:Tol biopolymer transport system component